VALCERLAHDHAAVGQRFVAAPVFGRRRAFSCSEFASVVIVSCRPPKVSQALGSAPIAHRYTMALAAIWLHHDRARHMRKNVAEVFVGAGRCEREREFVVGVQGLRPSKRIVVRGDAVRDIVLVVPGHGSATFRTAGAPLG
jgi:hypothetical protein